MLLTPEEAHLFFKLQVGCFLNLDLKQPFQRSRQFLKPVGAAKLLCQLPNPDQFIDV